ncbi:nucleotide-binding domain-containing protein [Actinomadura nitritigenes]|uniref:nucleotide-binding domain-containing protein n=1 Tax=Actinomadura nitritigenes TaxID=134602 RepID=UPI003D945E3C
MITPADASAGPGSQIIEQFIEEQYPVDITGSVAVDCEVTQNGWRRTRLREMLRTGAPLRADTLRPSGACGDAGYVSPPTTDRFASAHGRSDESIAPCLGGTEDSMARGH